MSSLAYPADNGQPGFSDTRCTLCEAGLTCRDDRPLWDAWAVVADGALAGIYGSRSEAEAAHDGQPERPRPGAHPLPPSVVVEIGELCALR